jgi:hypothetical protein
MGKLMGLACLLLNRIHTKRHELDAPIHDLARSGAALDAPPDRAHPAAPPSPRLSANRGCAPDCWCAAFPDGRHRSRISRVAMVLNLSPMEGENHADNHNNDYWPSYPVAS